MRGDEGEKEKGEGDVVMIVTGWQITRKRDTLGSCKDGDWLTLTLWAYTG